MMQLKENVYELAKTNISLGYMLTDSSGIIMDFNHAAEKITGFSKAQVTGISVTELFGSFMDEDGCYHKSFSWEALHEVSESEMIITTGSGERIHIAITSFPVFGNSGSYIGSGHFFRDISRRVQMENERKNLLAMFAHDIKNPASGSVLLVERMLAGKAGTLTDKQCEYLTIVRDSLSKIVEFTDSFVVYSKLGSQQLALTRKRCDLAAAVNNAMENLKGLILQKHLQVSLRDVRAKSVVCHCDAGMIERVLANIIGNSVKFSGENGCIEVKLSGTKKRVRCTVADNGGGIDAEALPHVLTPFYRGAGVDCSGSGLGLAIAKGIIEAHGGTIRVRSVEGKGTVVSFTIPKLDECREK